MKTRRAFLLGLLLSGALGGWVHTSEAETEPIVVVVNKSNPVSSLPQSELRLIFQTVRTNYSGGGDATPLNLPGDHALRQAFDQAVLGLNPERVARYWQDRKIRGGARPPKQLPAPGAVLAAVAADASAIGYVGAREANGSVKVVAKIVDGKVSAP